MKFDITNRWSGSVMFTAEIECAEDAAYSVKLGLAVKVAVKAGADLVGANLAGANLAGANLVDANLVDANLAGANLAGAKWLGGIVINRAPLQIFGLDYSVTILDQHMQIGCELHTLAEWAAFDDRRIAEMDGVRARKFWDAQKAGLLAMAAGDGRGKASE
jgi:hypothetical protein